MAAAMVAALVAPMLQAGPAAATDPVAGDEVVGTALEPVAVHEVTFSASELLAAAVRADGITASQPDLAGRVDEALSDRARQGTLVDERQMWVVALPDPFAEGEEIQLVWSGGRVPEKVTYAWADYGGGGETDVGVMALPIQLGGTGRLLCSGNGGPGCCPVES